MVFCSVCSSSGLRTYMLTPTGGTNWTTSAVGVFSRSFLVKTDSISSENLMYSTWLGSLGDWYLKQLANDSAHNHSLLRTHADVWTNCVIELLVSTCNRHFLESSDFFLSEAKATQVQSSAEGGCRDTTGAKFVIVPHELQHTHSFLHYLTNGADNIMSSWIIMVHINVVFLL